MYTRIFTDKPPTNDQMCVLQQLPLWKIASGLRVSAVNALLLPNDYLLPPDAQPPGNFVLKESPLGRNLIIVLGGKMKDPEEYVSRDVFPYIKNILWSSSAKKRLAKPSHKPVTEHSKKWDSCFNVVGRAIISVCSPQTSTVQPSDKALGKRPEQAATRSDLDRIHIPNIVSPSTNLPPVAMVEHIPSHGLQPARRARAVGTGQSRMRSTYPNSMELGEQTIQRPRHKLKQPASTRTTENPRRREINRTGLALLIKLLDFICKTPALLCSPFSAEPLVPNKNGDLCRIADLYNPTEPIFASSFEGNDAKFPHESVDLALLRKLGFNSIVTKASFKVCVQYLDNIYNAQTPSTPAHQRARLFQRASVVWEEFNARVHHFYPAWTGPEVQGLSEYYFVPAAPLTGHWKGYRDSVRTIPSEALISMKDVMTPHPSVVPVVWTQKYYPASLPSKELQTLFNMSTPTFDIVAKHLVDLSTLIAPKCKFDEVGFYQDLTATYDWLNLRTHDAARHLKEQLADKAVWLNEDMEYNLPRLVPGRDVPRHIGSLDWRRATFLVSGIQYDAPLCNIFALKQFLSNYQSLLIASGMNIVKGHFTRRVEEHPPDHSNTILGKSLNQMRQSQSLCDMTIIIDGKRFFAHRIVLATFSSFFNSMLANRAWAETSTGILDLDSEAPSRSRGNTKYASQRSVTAVLDWIYKGEIFTDDTKLEGTESIASRLDLYLEILQLTDVWEIPTLKTHIVNRILNRTNNFIRVENVSAVSELVNQYNAKEVAKHCREFIAKNRAVVDRIDAEGRL